ncbi:MAG: hypothetical protein BCS36_10695 [Desulfovibrio sp. MES5]|nr:MAG: hypothetical protein BCS36_10695 [Desulfovibrio sp. MES5]
MTGKLYACPSTLLFLLTLVLVGFAFSLCSPGEKNCYHGVHGGEQMVFAYSNAASSICTAQSQTPQKFLQQ